MPHLFCAAGLQYAFLALVMQTLDSSRNIHLGNSITHKTELVHVVALLTTSGCGSQHGAVNL